MQYRNKDLRREIRRADLTTGQVAEKMGLSKSGLFYRLQSKLTVEQKAEIASAIREAAKEQEKLERQEYE